VALAPHGSAEDLPRTPGGPPKLKKGMVTCTVASLTAGDSVTLTITVTATKPGTIYNTATKQMASPIAPTTALDYSGTPWPNS